MTDIQPISRIFLQIGPFTIYWYGIIIASGVLIGLWLATKEGERHGIPKNDIVDLVLIALPIAVLSARAYYVLFEWGYYSNHLGDIIKIWHGGIAIHGGLIGAVATAIVYTKKRKLSFWKVVDIIAPSLILGQAIGRWGNFMNQEAHGGEVTRTFLENLHLPTFIIDQMYIESAYYHPTFLYESMWSCLGFVVLLLLRRANLRRGELFLTYVIWYSVGRFFIEGLRTDSLMLFGALKMAQVISIVLITVALVVLIIRRKQQGIERYTD